MQNLYYHVVVPFNQLANFAALMRTLKDDFQSDFVTVNSNASAVWVLKSETGYPLPKRGLGDHDILVVGIEGEAAATQIKQAPVDWKSGQF